MAKPLKKSKGKSDKTRFTGIPHCVMNHPDWLKLSPNAIKLLLELAKQYNSKNNGNLTASWTIMKERGFKSKSTLTAAIKCLMSLNFIIRTREGFFMNPGKRCALYALTWQGIDECRGKHLDVKPTPAPPRVFQMEINMPSTKSVPTRYGNSTEQAA